MHVLICISTITLRFFSDDFLRLLLQCLEPTTTDIVDVRSEFTMVRKMCLEMQSVVVTTHESLTKLFILSDIRDEWMGKVLLAMASNKKHPDVPSRRSIHSSISVQKISGRFGLCLQSV